MKIIGDSLIPFKEYFRVLSIDDIRKTKPNGDLYFTYNEEILEFSFRENLSFYVEISNISQGLFANSLNARYIVCKDMNLAKDMQKIADNYIFDSKILLLIKNRDMLEEVALNEIDGVIIE